MTGLRQRCSAARRAAVRRCCPSPTSPIFTGSGSNILIDGSVSLNTAALDLLLSQWAVDPAYNATIHMALQGAVTYNTTNANTLQAGSGLDWFWAEYAQDHLNNKPRDLLN